MQVWCVFPAFPTTRILEILNAFAAERRRMAKVMDMSNHYEILDLAKDNINATEDQIRRAHRKLSKYTSER